MTPCAGPLQMRVYGNAAYRNVRVSCPGQGWQLYVPVTLMSSAPVVFAAHDLQAGVAIRRSDLKTESSSHAADQGGQLAHQKQSVIGRTLTAPVGSGTAIHLSSLRQAVKIHAGQTITVHVHSNAVDITTTAVALQDGRVGQSILVKNSGSGHRYRVEVTASGAVDDLSG